jgi:hypothetical protein
MKLVTVATHSQGYFPFLLQSCKRFNANLEVLGWGQKWQGFQWKFLLMKEYVSTLPDDEIVCFIDAYDVLLLRPLEELEETFKKLLCVTNKKIVVGCDQTNNDYIHNFVLYWVFNKCQDKHLNSGTYVGYVKDIRIMLNGIIELSNNPKSDDQVSMIQFCINNPYKIYIDSDSILFLTITTYLDKIDSNLVILNGELSYKWTKPFILHCPGNSSMNNIISKLGYHITMDEMNSYEKNYIYVLIKRLIHYLHFFWNLIITLIIIICFSLLLKKLYKNK